MIKVTGILLTGIPVRTCSYVTITLTMGTKMLNRAGDKTPVVAVTTPMMYTCKQLMRIVDIIL